MSPTQLVERQRAHFRSGATRSEPARREALDRLVQVITSHEDRLLEALAADLGKEPTEAYASEIGLVLGELRHARGHLADWMKAERRRVPMFAWPGRAHVQRDPLGVVLIIGPWNFPFQLLAAPLVAALAAGNCIVLKPSELAPATSRLVAGMIAEAFDECRVAVVEGGREVAEELLAQEFDHIFFTGSSSVGRAVMAAAARQLAPVTLELGGKCPAIVWTGGETGGAADERFLRVTARRIAWGKFMNAGQTCVAPDHVIVERKLHDPLVAALCRTVDEFYGGRPHGRLVNRRHFDRVAGYLGDGRIACGGAADPDGLTISPTVLTGVSPDAAVMREEIFGPVLPVIPGDRLDEVLGRIAERPSPLAVYLFSESAAVRDRVVGATRSGGVCVNDTLVQITGPELPFGGVGESGIGRYHGRAGFDTFTCERVVMKRSMALDPGFRYPPPRNSLGTMKRVFRFLAGR